MGFNWPAFEGESLPWRPHVVGDVRQLRPALRDCYYLVQLFEGERDVGRFMVAVSMDFAPDNN